MPSSQRVGPAQQYLVVPLQDEIRVSRSDVPAPTRARSDSLHELTNRVIASDFDPAVVGDALLRLAERRDGIELSIAFASIIAKARLSRHERDQREAARGPRPR